MSPIETRDEIERFISRALFGPSHASENNWLESTANAGIVNETFSCDQVRPVGPWVNENNEEVLSTPPYFVYGVGVLFPKISAQVQAEVDGALEAANQEIPSSDFESAQTQNLNADDSEATRDDSDQVSESITKPRTMAISIRVPIATDHLKVRLTGGSYEQVAVNGQTRTWWSRTAHNFELEINLDSPESHKLIAGSVNLEIGFSTRTQDKYSKIVTVWVRNNTSALNSREFSEKCFFQTQLSLEVAEVLPYEARILSKVTSLDLLYRNQRKWASGHGTDTSISEIDHGWLIQSNAVPLAKVIGLTPEIPHKVGMLDLHEFNESAISEIQQLIESYETWVTKISVEKDSLPKMYLDIGNQHVKGCKTFLERIKAGWKLVQENSDVRTALQDMSLAMNQQRIAYGAPLREVVATPKGELLVSGENPHTNFKGDQSRWRAFQIAFILASISNVVNPSKVSEQSVDVIWMPTGGGKTEAYLGLAGFVILWERLISVKTQSENSQKASTKVFMRYTLRLLTSQQLTRAASLICALELVRRSKTATYGRVVIRIGAWLGSATSPNTHEAATSLYSKMIERKANGKSFMLTRCPWCAAQIGHVEGETLVGYRKVSHPNPAIKTKRVMAACPAQDCEFKFEEILNPGNTTYVGIPVLEVDEDLYLAPPDFVVGTIDKVARLAWVPEAQMLFGLKSGKRRAAAPKLFIQDELHLIAGPLGSIDGCFEALLEHLCEADGGSTPIIVAATATTKNFEDQLERLYARSGGLIPPPGLEINDSFFAVKDFNDPGKHYLAVSPTGYGSALNAQARTLAALSHAAGVINNAKKPADPWWTNVIFFSSRRSLGQLHSQIETGFKSFMVSLRELTGVSSGSKRKDKDGNEIFNVTRYVRNLKQLTSTSTDNLNQVLDELSVEISEKNIDPIDMCFATSMIEVGLDVPRLGLMTVIGQPKSASQYIQVSGRVGRGSNGPGLIVTFLAPHNVRDRSHYENFSDWHQRLYASVENSSVTPFTSRALERSAPSVLTAMLRIFGDPKGVKASYEKYWKDAVQVLNKRAEKFENSATVALNGVLEDLERLITSPSATSAVWDSKYGISNFFIYGADSVIPAEKLQSAYWRVLNSMRSVEGDAGFLVSQASKASGDNSVPASDPTYEDEGYEI